ncbi:hypothetical protein MC885_013938 [Smutsia gigantea]|nr:hypothetical protein MC885_013938 [Smutsia gigantea]
MKRGRGPFKTRPSLPQNFPVSALLSIPDGRPGSPPSWRTRRAEASPPPAAGPVAPPIGWGRRVTGVSLPQ